MRNIVEFLRLSTELGDKYGVHLPKLTVAVLGSYNAGKSTLINGLLNTRLSPVDVVPTTQGLIFFNYGKTFSAEVHTGSFKTKRFRRPGDFLQFITTGSVNHNSFERAEVFIDNPLLKRITVVDSPGLDGPFMHHRPVEKLISQADKLVYLFHQRGIEEFNKRWLLQLADRYKQKRPEISFWINCNLGNFDGTSLEETRSVLKEIFPGQLDLHTINTQNAQNLELLKYYLETDIAAWVLEQVRTVMLQKDLELQQSVKLTANTGNNTEFLLQYARLKQTVEELLGHREQLYLASGTRQQLKKLLKNNNLLNTKSLVKSLVSGNRNQNTLNFNKIKVLLSDLLTRIMKEPAVKIPDSRRLADLAGKINKEHFTIVAAGGFSSGKSTFFNAIMGEEILPAQSKPTTFAITQISYGPLKKAVINFASRVTLQLYDRVKGKIEPRSDELNTLTQWLLKANPEITSYEIYEKKRFKQVSRQECLKILENFRQQFNRSPGDLSGPTLYKIVPSKLLALNQLTKKIRLTFKPTQASAFDLSNQAGREAFHATVNHTNAFRLERVEVYHPAEYLKTASFLDTPGLDSTHKYHSEITTDYLQNSDAYLIFLNARHLLINQEGDNPIEIISGRIRDYLIAKPTAYRKIFFILNFADTLTRAEREKVINLVKCRLFTTGAEAQIYTISSLSALLQKDDGSFQRLLSNLARSVSDYRGKEILSTYIKEIRFILNTAANSGKIPNAISGPRLNLCKYSATQYLIKGKVSLLRKIKNRFAQLDQLIQKLDNEQSFTGFLQGTRKQKKGLLFKTGTTVNCPTYFRWVTDINDYITYSCKKIAEQTEKNLNRHLEQLPTTATLHLNTAPPPTLQISPVHQQIIASLEQNRGLFGRIKEREVRRDLNKLLAEEQQRLIQNLNRWTNQLLQEIAAKLGPVYTRLNLNLAGTVTGQKLSPVQKNYNPALAGYLKKLNEIETLLKHPGGNGHGKCQNP